MIRKKMLRKFVGHSNRNKLIYNFGDIVINDKEELKNHRFVFSGEFGYEIISWLPYLNFLSKDLGIKIRTASRKGSKVFYEKISFDHLELDDKFLGDMWGELNKVERLMLFHKNIITPINENINRKICIVGIDWNNRNIHDKIILESYSPLKFSKDTLLSYPDLKCLFQKELKNSRIAIINNKNYYNWGNLTVRNFYTREELIIIRDYLLSQNFYIIYNNIKTIQESANDYEELYDYDIFKCEGCFDLNQMPELCSNIDLRNRLQIYLFYKADLCIGTQGGNAYLPATCRNPQFILMRKGNYLDYTELGKIYGVPVSCFYEVDQLILLLKDFISRNR